MPLVIVLEADGEVRLVDLPREDYEQPEMNELIGAVKVESFGPQDYHEEGAHHHHHGHHHGDGKPPTLQGLAHKRAQRKEQKGKEKGSTDGDGNASDSSYSSFSDSDFSDDELSVIDDGHGHGHGHGGDDGEVKEAKGEEAASSVLSIQMIVDANASLRPTANCPFPRINWKGTRVYKRWLKGHMPVLNKVLIAFLQLPHDHMSLYADYSPYLVDPPERFVEILRDMEKDDHPDH